MKTASPQWHDLQVEQINSESTGRLFSSYLVHKGGGSWSQVFLAKSVETGDKNSNVTGATKTFCEESLRCFDIVFQRPYRIFSIALKVILSLSDRYKILTSNWLWIEICENVVLSKLILL